MKLLLFLAMSGTLACLANTENSRPIIGVLAQETNAASASIGDSFIRNSYTRFVEASGARALPIKVNQSDEYYEKIFNSTNGLLIPGGSVNVVNSSFSSIARKFFKWAVAANDAGDNFPIWGSCLGAQMLASFATEDYADAHRSKVNGWNLSLPANFTQDFRKSRMYKDIPENIVAYAKKNPVEQHMHNRAVLTETFNANKHLQEFFRVTSLNTDEEGKEYIGGMEGRNYPFFYFQFHPEKNLYEWDRYVMVSHEPMAILFAQHLGLVFINEARKSKHKFTSYEEETSLLIANYQTTHVSEPFEMDLYIFNNTSQNEESQSLITSALKNVTTKCRSMALVTALLVVTLLVSLLSCVFCICIYRSRVVAMTAYNPIK